jgi:hypothetical protein
MTNTCKLRPYFDVVKKPKPFDMVLGFAILWESYFKSESIYFYGLSVVTFGRGVFIGFKKVCR